MHAHDGFWVSFSFTSRNGFQFPESTMKSSELGEKTAHSDIF
ncbi:hypothetical protein QSI_1219 [Clostridioides difficile P28]|nr:hypothetical protein QSI_1219 [Clostridioides difficile P28]